MIDITFDEIGEHIEKGDLKAWLSELKVVDAMKHLRMYEPQTDKWSHDCIGCANNNTCEFAFTDAVKICKYVKTEPQTETVQGTGDCEHCSRLFIDCDGR